MKNQINALIIEMKEQYSVITDLYNKSLSQKDVPVNLQVKIKNFFENAKSTLDYIAHEIANNYNIKNKIIYFPICSGDSISSFDRTISKNLPNIKLKNTELYNYLESLQPYHKNNAWFKSFATITNEKKHVLLSPQKIQKEKRVIAKSTSGSVVSWNPERVHFGDGVYINGVKVDPNTQRPLSTPSSIVIDEIWVSFLFKDGSNVLDIIGQVQNNIPKIIEKIWSLLDERN